MAHLLLGKEAIETGELDPAMQHSRWQRFNAWRNRAFERLEQAYAKVLRTLLALPAFVLVMFLVLIVATGALATLVGLDFFPSVDTGQLKLHVRGPIGMRIDDTERLVPNIDPEIPRIIPAREPAAINDNLGQPLSLNLAPSH